MSDDVSGHTLLMARSSPMTSKSIMTRPSKISNAVELVVISESIVHAFLIVDVTHELRNLGTLARSSKLL